ncbi:hypothetical protein NCTGTJJY_CDS0260 [Serratia phage 92A1]|nr:hypothetical protein NCTGTJJY_CDS0260 [Serratia phage 92A1]
MSYQDVTKLRAKRGKAAEKAELVKEFRILESMGWSFVILASGCEKSTYDGRYPEGIGKARENHMEKIKAIKDKIREICHDA